MELQRLHAADLVQISGQRDRQIQEAAVELEANFLAEMLKSIGAGDSKAFGGGAGEDQFASFLRLEQAREMARSGGIGLAEVLFEAMKEAENAR